MSKHNYSQYSNKKNENKVDTTPDVTAEIQNGVDTDTNVEVVTLEQKTTTDTNVDVVTLEQKTTTETNSGAVATGVVAKCAKLNVRSKPSTTADVITVLNANDILKIDVDKSTDEWFKICTTNGINGYCMRQFVNANI